jgi:hypothetical protein
MASCTTAPKDVADELGDAFKKLEATEDAVEDSYLKLASERKLLQKKYDEGAATEEDIHRFKKTAEDFEEKKTKFDSETAGVASKTGQSVATTRKKFSAFLRKKDAKFVRDLLQSQQTLSLCFVFDATASMGPFWQGLKACIRSIIAEQQRSMKHFQFELGGVVYRDDVDGNMRFQTHPFSGSISAFERFLDSVQAIGGADQCEDVIGGLKQAADMDFGFVNKLVFLCGDAPCHGSDYHDNCGDTNGIASNLCPSQPVIQALRQKGVALNFLKINDTTDKMIAKFNEEAGDEDWITTMQLDCDGYDRFDSLTGTMRDGLIKSISSSISDAVCEISSRTFSASAKKSDKLRKSRNYLEKMETVDEESGESSATEGGGLPAAVAIAVTSRGGAEKSLKERLSDLKALYDDGLLEESEYKERKKEILREV